MDIWLTAFVFCALQRFGSPAQMSLSPIEMQSREGRPTPSPTTTYPPPTPPPLSLRKAGARPSPRSQKPEARRKGLGLCALRFDLLVQLGLHAMATCGPPAARRTRAFASLCLSG
jgi:hypothetical protein